MLVIPAHVHRHGLLTKPLTTEKETSPEDFPQKSGRTVRSSLLWR